jgi:hypothetical protein
MNDRTHVYVTKYCLTDEVTYGRIAEGYPQPYSADGKKQHVLLADDRWFNSYVVGRDAFYTWPEAKADAEARRRKRMISLTKQIDALKNRRFLEPVKQESAP